MAKKASSGARASAHKIFIVDDHPVFREGLAQMVSREPGLAVCGSAGTAEEALKLLPHLKPDLVLVDLTLPGMSGLELIKQIRASDTRTKLLVVSMHDEAVYANRVLRLGGDGYIMKQEDPAEIVQAIQDVLHGHIYVSEEVLGKSEKNTHQHRNHSRPLDQLTDSQVELLELLGRGMSPHEIARQLRLSERAVTAESREIRNRLKLKSDNALIRYAVCWVETGAT